jgi:hypothetical protein
LYIFRQHPEIFHIQTIECVIKNKSSDLEKATECRKHKLRQQLHSNISDRHHFPESSTEFEEPKCVEHASSLLSSFVKNENGYASTLLWIKINIGKTIM